MKVTLHSKTQADRDVGVDSGLGQLSTQRCGVSHAQSDCLVAELQ